ncbi:class I SAM-dependent methyltransferase [Candidatus Lokiarchaeum ossiferum]|uniref:class I SAM-dependent methyltransferase n=1 Tax=Candidatus Lokiarchaeum ossiferum TaxID=2951803 RepID=UPI00352E3605
MTKVNKFWDNQAKNYDKSEERYDQIHLKITKNTLKYLHEDNIVLDYGCGTGTKTLLLADKVEKIHGIDISLKMIEKARSKTIKHKIMNVKFEHSPILKTDFENEKFDVILAFNVLHVIDNIHHVLPRIHQLLKPGGLFISATPCLKEKMQFLKKLQLTFYSFMIKFGVVPNFLTKFKFSDMERHISNEKFHILDTEQLYYKVSNYFIVAKKV